MHRIIPFQLHLVSDVLRDKGVKTGNEAFVLFHILLVVPAVGQLVVSVRERVFTVVCHGNPLLKREEAERRWKRM